ncbi:MAG: hypothetical protein NTW19_20675 [Planctomycetota bacterium]|nr:hypothetical protein [Planctomycetota bacterium]
MDIVLIGLAIPLGGMTTLVLWIAWLFSLILIASWGLGLLGMPADLVMALGLMSALPTFLSPLVGMVCGPVLCWAFLYLDSDPPSLTPSVLAKRIALAACAGWLLSLLGASLMFFGVVLVNGLTERVCLAFGKDGVVSTIALPLAFAFDIVSVPAGAIVGGIIGIAAAVYLSSRKPKIIQAG